MEMFLGLSLLARRWWDGKVESKQKAVDFRTLPSFQGFHGFEAVVAIVAAVIETDVQIIGFCDPVGRSVRRSNTHVKAITATIAPSAFSCPSLTHPILEAP